MRLLGFENGSFYPRTGDQFFASRQGEDQGKSWYHTCLISTSQHNHSQILIIRLHMITHVSVYECTAQRSAVTEKRSQSIIYANLIEPLNNHDTQTPFTNDHANMHMTMIMRILN